VSKRVSLLRQKLQKKFYGSDPLSVFQLKATCWRTNVSFCSKRNLCSSCVPIIIKLVASTINILQL